MPLWAMVRPWLDPVTKEKFFVLGGSYQSALLEKIDPDQLPVEYGGTCQCEGGCLPAARPELLEGVPVWKNRVQEKTD